MDALDSMPDVSYDHILEHITALLFICHIPEFTHFIMQMSPDWYEGFVQFQTGGNFICLCKSKKQNGWPTSWALRTFSDSRWWPASGRSFNFLFKPNRQFNYLNFPLETLLRILLVVLHPIGRPPVGPPPLVSLAAAAILAAGGSKLTVKSFRSGLAKKSYCMNKADLFLIDDQGLDCTSCSAKWHTWSCIQNNKNIV